MAGRVRDVASEVFDIGIYAVDDDDALRAAAQIVLGHLLHFAHHKVMIVHVRERSGGVPRRDPILLGSLAELELLFGQMEPLFAAKLICSQAARGVWVPVRRLRGDCTAFHFS